MSRNPYPALRIRKNQRFLAMSPQQRQGKIGASISFESRHRSSHGTNPYGAGAILTDRGGDCVDKALVFSDGVEAPAPHTSQAAALKTHPHVFFAVLEKIADRVAGQSILRGQGAPLPGLADVNESAVDIGKP